jgi:hypothetical protein
MLGIVAAWMIAVLAGAVASARQARDAAEEARRETELMRQQVAAGRAEIDLVQGPGFLELEARAYGMGQPGERAFALARGAPDPLPITPLGTDPIPLPPPGPIEELLDVLLGVT